MTRSWELELDLAAGEASGPVYKQIADAIRAEIERGRLRAGERLPSSRGLADRLGVNRNTVVAAFDALRAGGWIEAAGTAGTRVAAQVPREAAATPPDLDLPPRLRVGRPVPRTPGLHLLLGGVPDLRLLPHRELARAYRTVLSGPRGRRGVDYADPQGNERLRVALADLLSRTRGVPARPEQIAVVRGSQHGLYLAARALLRPGDRVAIEVPGFSPGWQAMALAGAELVPIPVDEDGLDTDALAAECARAPIRAAVVTPHHQYPTTVPLSRARRAALLALAAEHRFAIVEDDYDHEFHYDGPPLLPLAAADAGGRVVYVGTLSKILAPGLRLGWVFAAREVIERVVDYRWLVDQQGDHVLEQAVAQLVEEGVVQRHVRRARRVYAARRDALCAALAANLPGLEFTVPPGGMAVWARAPGVDAAAWAREGLPRGVAFQSAAGLLDPRGPQATEHVRLGFAACSEPELAQAVARMASCPAWSVR